MLEAWNNPVPVLPRRDLEGWDENVPVEPSHAEDGALLDALVDPLTGYLQALSGFRQRERTPPVFLSSSSDTPSNAVRVSAAVEGVAALSTRAATSPPRTSIRFVTASTALPGSRSGKGESDLADPVASTRTKKALFSTSLKGLARGRAVHAM